MCICWCKEWNPNSNVFRPHLLCLPPIQGEVVFWSECAWLLGTCLPAGMNDCSGLHMSINFLLPNHSSCGTFFAFLDQRHCQIYADHMCLCVLYRLLMASLKRYHPQRSSLSLNLPHDFTRIHSHNCLVSLRTW